MDILGSILYEYKEQIYPKLNDADNDFFMWVMNIIGRENEYYSSHFKSQNFQDVWVEWRALGRGFTQPIAIEFGGHDGIDGSNTYGLEAGGWLTYLAEPNPSSFIECSKNRKNVSPKCIYKETGLKIPFVSVISDLQLSTIEGYQNSDYNAAKRIAQENPIIEVETITLYDYLKEIEVPDRVEYISVDTEGTELEILQKFFEENNKYDVKMFTVEHNYNREIRDNLHDLFVSQGYIREFTWVSRWDDFYVKKDYIDDN